MDFEGWLGAIIDLDEPANDRLDMNPEAPWFEVLGGGFAQLSTDAEYDVIVLYQSFRLDPAARALTFDYDWELTAGVSLGPDFVQATLLREDPFFAIDLFPGIDTEAAAGSGTVTTDISRLAGREVFLEFLVQDGDFAPIDYLRIGNIQIAAVPLPPTLSLMLAGMLLLVTRRRSSATR